MAIQADESRDRFSLEPDESWSDKDLARLDPGLYWVVTLIEAGEWEQVFRRTGVQLDVKPDLSNEAGQSGRPDQYLPLLLELKWPDISVDAARDLITKTLELAVPEAYFSEARPTHMTAGIRMRPADFRRTQGRESPLRQQLVKTLGESRVIRLELPGASQAFNEDALGDFGLGPGSRPYKGEFLDGSGVVIGIIDDGCALAHRNFLAETAAGTLESRILHLWDQAGTGTRAGWANAAGYYGLEIDKAGIDQALSQHAQDSVVDEDKVYEDLGYMPDLATHGTHVMDIAAGNGKSLMGSEGVAPCAYIIFVQLPANAITSGGRVLDQSIVDGMDYIFSRAGDKRVVINISYGGYFGPHDGTGFVEQAIDTRLAQTNRAVVVAAGNGYEADCHAHGDLAKKGDTLTKPLRWILKP